MIKIYAPTATALQMAFWTDKTLDVEYKPVSLSLGEGSVAVGYTIEIDEPNEKWAIIKPVVAAFADLLPTNRVRVQFDGFDPSGLGGRLSAQSYWVNSDGTQTLI